MGNSFLIKAESILRGDIRAESPRIKPILAILLPIIVPMAISLVSFIAANIHTAASGDDVPKATIVIPIIMGLIPKEEASLEEPLTSPSAPRYKIIRPNINKKK
jgi:hypothetical protein